MKLQLLNDPLDVEWLRTSHLKRHDPPQFKAFVLTGNEDAPEGLELYSDTDPNTFDVPVAVYQQDEQGRLVRAR